MTGTLTGLPLPAPFLTSLRQSMERLADGPLAPALDLYTTARAIVAKVAVPGVKPENIEVMVGTDLVTISGSPEQKGRDDVGHVHDELMHRPFRRSFWLPTAVKAEAATASLTNGLLTLTMPKTKVGETKRVRVEVI